MNVLRLRAKLISWLALVAMLALALTPTFARALNRAQVDQGQWLGACGLHGATREARERLAAVDSVAVEAAVSEAQAAADAEAAGRAAQLQARGNLEHCSDCSLASEALALAPAHTPPGLNRNADHRAPPLLRPPYTLLAWRSPRSRAPPLTA